jgi:hypothetical protein
MPAFNRASSIPFAQVELSASVWKPAFGQGEAGGLGDVERHAAFVSGVTGEALEQVVAKLNLPHVDLG